MGKVEWKVSGEGRVEGKIGEGRVEGELGR